MALPDGFKGSLATHYAAHCDGVKCAMHLRPRLHRMRIRVDASARPTPFEMPTPRPNRETRRASTRSRALSYVAQNGGPRLTVSQWRNLRKRATPSERDALDVIVAGAVIAGQKG